MSVDHGRSVGLPNASASPLCAQQVTIQPVALGLPQQSALYPGGALKCLQVRRFIPCKPSLRPFPADRAQAAMNMEQSSSPPPPAVGFDATEVNIRLQRTFPLALVGSTPILLLAGSMQAVDLNCFNSSFLGVQTDILELGAGKFAFTCTRTFLQVRGHQEPPYTAVYVLWGNPYACCCLLTVRKLTVIMPCRWLARITSSKHSY